MPASGSDRGSEWASAPLAQVHGPVTGTRRPAQARTSLESESAGSPSLLPAPPAAPRWCSPLSSAQEEDVVSRLSLRSRAFLAMASFSAACCSCSCGFSRSDTHNHAYAGPWRIPRALASHGFNSADALAPCPCGTPRVVAAVVTLQPQWGCSGCSARGPWRHEAPGAAITTIIARRNPLLDARYARCVQAEREACRDSEPVAVDVPAQ
jgi:hypothetical protein